MSDSSEKKKVGIVGAAGYTAGELIRLLINHPKLEIFSLQSSSQAGKKVSEIHRDLYGDINNRFDESLNSNSEIIFICSGHGKTDAVMDKYPWLDNKIVIDLSADHRMDRNKAGFVYGLPEYYREDIQKAKKIANPGCFATCIQLGLLPVAKYLNKAIEIHTQAITGSTGAGAGLSATSHFSWRQGNASIYKAFKHQHLAEISATLDSSNAEGDNSKILFIPMRGAFTRGILASSYLKWDKSEEETYSLFENYYKDEPFTFVTRENPDIKQVVNSNKCLVYPSVIDGHLHVVSVIDNLLKGASGQAIQNLNIMMAWEETAGLKLKTISF